MATVGDQNLEATIIWTDFGVPHISAGSWGSLGFGQGYAAAGDHMATIADSLVKVRGTRSEYHGPGEGNCHLLSDIGYAVFDLGSIAASAMATQPDWIVELVDGYAAGINEWLGGHRDQLPEWCLDTPWVREVTCEDLFTIYADLAIIASGRNFARMVGSARPPGSTEREIPHQSTFSDQPPLASNGWAIGGDRTASGRGMVVANPHFPWYGEARFWENHLTIPGTYDCYGASLVGTPGIQLGFNSDLAWTHTFSRGHRFCVYGLDLDSSSPTSYRFGSEVREMTSVEVSVEVAGTDHDQDPDTVTVERFASHHGPIVDLPILGWSESKAFALRDANLGNDRFLGQFLAMGSSMSVRELADSQRRIEGVPWVNTLAADSTGEAYYADTSTTPALSEQAKWDFVASLETDIVAALLFEQRAALLDGSNPSHDWIEVEGAVSLGLEPTTALPSVFTRRELLNANDPYWFVNERDLLDEATPMAGLYRSPLSARTKTNAWLLSEEGPLTETGDPNQLTAKRLVDVLFANRSVMVELLIDQVIDRLWNAPKLSKAEPAGDSETDFAALADVLRDWDRRFDTESVGAILWREIIGSFKDSDIRDAGGLFSDPFDPASPLAGPTDLTVPDSPSDDAILEAARAAIAALEAAGLDLETPLGQAQYVDRADRRWPMHGGGEADGVANIVMSYGGLERDDTEPPPDLGEGIESRSDRSGLRVGGYPITYGSSFIMAVEFTDDGPVAEALCVYGQSGDPASPHHVDQLELYRSKVLRPCHFTQDQIAAAAAKSIVVRSTKT